MKDGQTIAQQIKWDFKTNGNLIINDKKDNLIYFENSTGFWLKREYDCRGYKIYLENSNGFWVKYEYDSTGNQIYYQCSNGKIIDKRPPEVIEHNGRKYQLIP